MFKRTVGHNVGRRKHDDVAIRASLGDQIADRKIDRFQDVDNRIADTRPLVLIMIAMITIMNVPEHVCAAVRFLECKHEQIPRLLREKVEACVALHFHRAQDVLPRCPGGGIVNGRFVAVAALAGRCFAEAGHDLRGEGGRIGRGCLGITAMHQPVRQVDAVQWPHGPALGNVDHCNAMARAGHIVPKDIPIRLAMYGKDCIALRVS